VFTRSWQFPTSCLNVARKGSRSDLRNRMFRPITRRWGICFRSTQRYTVWTLTPKYTAASRTLSGTSSGTSANPTALPPGELKWGRYFGFIPICKAFSLFKPKVCWGHLKMGRAAVAQSTCTAPKRLASWVTRMPGYNAPPARLRRYPRREDSHSGASRGILQVRIAWHPTGVEETFWYGHWDRRVGASWNLDGESKGDRNWGYRGNQDSVEST